MRNYKGQFLPGHTENASAPLGTEAVRTRHRRSGERRVFIKVGQPNKWVLRARLVWEMDNGPIPRGLGIHHKNEDTLDDRISNLELVTKARHLAIHRPQFADKAAASFAETRRRLRWSTKSATKKTGRPCAWSDATMLAAVAALKAGEGELSEVARRFGVTKGALHKRAKRT